MFCYCCCPLTNATAGDSEAPPPAAIETATRRPAPQTRSFATDTPVLSRIEKMRKDLVDAECRQPRWMATDKKPDKEQKAYIEEKWKALQERKRVEAGATRDKIGTT